MPMWTRCALVALALVSLTLLVVPTPGGRDAVQTFVQVCCLALAAYHVRRHRSVLRLGWGLLVVAVTLLGASDMLGALERHLLNFGPGPTPSNVVALSGCCWDWPSSSSNATAAAAGGCPVRSRRPSSRPECWPRCWCSWSCRSWPATT